MKDLKQYILSGYKLPDPYSGQRTLEEFCDINNINIENITEKHLKYYNIQNYRGERDHDSYMEWIRESLTSHSTEILASKIQKIINCNIYANTIKNTDNRNIIIEVDQDSEIISGNIMKTFILNDCIKSSKIYDLLDFFNYYITTVDKVSDKYYIHVEPKYTKEYPHVNILYHITHKSNVKNILKKGLKPKVGKARINGGYRYFPEKLFLLPHTSTIIDDIKQIIHDKKYKDYAIIKIDLTDHNIGLFIDDYSDNPNNIYTFEYIPSYLLEEINIDHINK